MAAALFAIALAFGGAALTVLVADADWAKNHAWLGPLFAVIAVVSLLSAMLEKFLRRSKPPVAAPVPPVTQDAHGHSSPNIIATHGSSVNVGFGTPPPEPASRPFIRPVEYCERTNGEYLRVVNEGQRAYDLYTEPLRLGDWIVNFHRLPDLSGEGQINVLRIAKQVGETTVLSTLQKLERAWLEVEKVNPGFSKPWIRIHYHDHRNIEFLSQCRLVRLRDPSGRTSFHFTTFTDEPVQLPNETVPPPTETQHPPQSPPPETITGPTAGPSESDRVKRIWPILAALAMIGCGVWAWKTFRPTPQITAKTSDPAPQISPREPTSPSTGKLPDNPSTAPAGGESPLDGLTNLGWTVIADPTNGTRIQFQNRLKPLPDMHKSAHYIGLIHGPISLGIIEAQSLEGLSTLGSIKNIETLTLAGTFNNLAEIRGMKLIRRLELIGQSVNDLDSVAALVQLRELTLEQRPDKILEIGPLKTLANLKKLTLVQFHIRSLSAIPSMVSLTVLDLSSSLVPDLAPIRNAPALAELTIDQRMVPGLPRLAGGNLKTLHIGHEDGTSDFIDLTPVADLQGLEALDIIAAGSLTLTPLRKLSGLSSLTITGTTVTYRDPNFTLHLQDANAITELHNLRTLGLAWIDVQNTDFLRGLSRLETIYINQTRSLSDIRALGTLQSLQSIQLAATDVVDISPLLNLEHLKTLTLQVTPARFDVITELKNRGVTIK